MNQKTISVGLFCKVNKVGVGLSLQETMELQDILRPYKIRVGAGVVGLPAVITKDENDENTIKSLAHDVVWNIETFEERLEMPETFKLTKENKVKILHAAIQQILHADDKKEK